MWIVSKHLSKSESKILYSEMCRKNALRRSTLYVIVRFQTLPTVYSILLNVIKPKPKSFWYCFCWMAKWPKLWYQSRNYVYKQEKQELRPQEVRRLQHTGTVTIIEKKTEYNLYRVALMQEMSNVVIINSTGWIKDYRNSFRLQSGRLCQKNKLRAILRKNSLPDEKRSWTNGYEKSAAIQFYPG